MLAFSLQRLLEQELQRELDAITESQSRIQDGMTHAESRAENDKDTRAIESSYLARGLATRVAQLRSALATIQAWKLPSHANEARPRALLGRILSLVDEENDSEQRVWLAPAGGGARLEHEARAFLVLTPDAPLGRALLGRELDDEVEVKSPSGIRRWLIEAIED